MQLVRPGLEHLASYVAALERGWSADNERGVDAAREELSRIHADSRRRICDSGNCATATTPDG